MYYTSFSTFGTWFSLDYLPLHRLLLVTKLLEKDMGRLSLFCIFVFTFLPYRKLAQQPRGCSLFAALVMRYDWEAIFLRGLRKE